MADLNKPDLGQTASVLRDTASNLPQDKQSSKADDFSYREVSEISDATDDVYAESPNVRDPDADLNDYNRLVHNTQQRLKLLGKHSLFNFSDDDRTVLP
jgi:hypothetical protein